MGVSYKYAKLGMAAIVILALLVHLSNASYTVKNLNVTVNLNQNSSAQVEETLHVLISNESVSQYSTNRAALNLTLSDWQQLIGPTLTEHIINPASSAYGFKFLPGPVTRLQSGGTANILLIYYVKNVTFVNLTGPRTYMYRFNTRVFNFEHGVSGQILNPNTTFTIVMPQGSAIKSVYPIPDVPADAFATNYQNVTSISWKYSEPLSKFTLVFVVRQSLQAEVSQFFTEVYDELGIYMYMIIAAAVIVSLLYVYRRASE